MLQYLLYEQSYAALGPARIMADVTRLFCGTYLNPFSHTFWGRGIEAACEVFERTTRRYAQPAFDIPSTIVDGEPAKVHEEVVWERPFCRLLHFKRHLRYSSRDPKLVIVAPMSGHYATLLRGTVEAMLPRHDVYVTDWIDARKVPLSEGSFDLDDYIDYLIDMFRLLGGDFHVMAVCQPSVAVLAAVAIMEEAGDPHVPTSMVLMGGPIDTRKNPTAVDHFATARGTDWFRRHMITKVPFGHPGYLRDVYPGFLQLCGFMGMNLDRHLAAHRNFFFDLVHGDDEPAEKHRDFYDEYLAVMDITAEFFLQTIDTIFVHHRLAKGEMEHRGRRLNLAAIRHVALMTIEGERDEICGLGQTEAAHHLCVNLPQSFRAHYVQPNVGHYGIFSGSQFRQEIVPRVTDFILKAEKPQSIVWRRAAGCGRKTG
jgi:poly(3-hydroxybutyrate) depolymerase